MLWDSYFLFYDKIKFGIFKLGVVRVFSLFGIRVSVILFEYILYIYVGEHMYENVSNVV